MQEVDYLPFVIRHFSFVIAISSGFPL